jgi:hypothetical protein
MNKNIFINIKDFILNCFIGLNPKFWTMNENYDKNYNNLISEIIKNNKKFIR